MGGWTCSLSVLIYILPFIHHSSFPTTSSLPAVILRCGGHLHHSGVGCHLHSGCRRARYKSLYQVQPGNTNKLIFPTKQLFQTFFSSDQMRSYIRWCDVRSDGWSVLRLGNEKGRFAKNSRKGIIAEQNKDDHLKIISIISLVVCLRSFKILKEILKPINRLSK